MYIPFSVRFICIVYIAYMATVVLIVKISFIRFAHCVDSEDKLYTFCTLRLRVLFTFHIQWNLGHSNTNSSKLPDFSKTTDGPDFFHYNLLQKYYRFFEISIFRKNQFLEQIRRSQSKKFILKSPAKFEIPNCQSRSRMMMIISLFGEFDCYTRVTSRVYSLPVIDTGLTVNIPNRFVGPNQRNSFLIPCQIRNSKLPIKVTHDDHDFFVQRVRLLHTRVTS